MSEPESDILHAMIESLPTGTIIVNAAGVILRLNRRIETWFGYSRDELLGKSIDLLVPERFRSEHGALRASYMANPKVRPMGANRDLYGRRRDGTEFACDISLHPLPMSDGMAVLVHIVDATPRKQAEAQQRHDESLRRMQFIVENLPAGAIYVSLEQGTLLVNRTFSAMTGYAPEELVDLPRAFDLLFRERAVEVRRQHDEDRRDGFRVSRELEITRKDGRKAWVEVSAYRYNEHEVWLWHDITERLAAQNRLLRSARLSAIGEMMTGLAHESRNALQRARAALDTLELDLENQPRLLALSRRAASALDELQRLQEEVRNYAAPIHLERREADLLESWRESWGQVHSIYPAKGARSISHAEPGAQRAFVDRYRISQVFRNILENAFAVLPDDGGKIEFSARLIREPLDGAETIEIVIQDNGPGMNAEQRARVFEPFFTTKTRGTGLGMAIVKRVMEAHGGSAQVADSERGARVELRLPREPSSVEITPRSIGAEVASQDATGSN